MTTKLAGEKAMARNDLAVKMDSGVVRKAKIVAMDRNITLAQYLSEKVAPLVERDYQETVARMAEEAVGDKASGRGRKPSK